MKRLLTILFLITAFTGFAQIANHGMYYAYVSDGVTPAQPADPISCWDLDETAGTVVDDACGVNDGTNVGTAGLMSTGVVNYAYDFNGTTDYINTNLSTHYTEFSFSCWFYADSYGEGGSGSGRIYEKRQSGSQVNLLWVNDGTVEPLIHYIAFAQVFSTTMGLWLTPDYSISTGSWYHVVVTYDNSSTSNDPVIYINGVSQTITESSEPSGTLVTNTDNYIIGNRGTVDRSFDGKLDIPQIYDFELTEANVAYLYNSGSGRACDCTPASTVPVYEATGGIIGVTSTNIDVPYPTTVNADDILFLHIMNKGDGSAPSPPSGWNTYYVANGTLSAGNYWKRATGSESGTVTVTTSSNDDKGGIMYRYSGVGTSTSPSSGAIGVNTTSTGETAAITGVSAELGVSIFGISNNITATKTAGTGWVENSNLSTSNGGGWTFVNASYDFDASETSTDLTYTWTSSSVYYYEFIIED